MTTSLVSCDEKGRLVAYLYEEDTPHERAAFEAHLAICPACADEVRALGAVRTELAGWRAPDAALGFRVVQDAPAARRRAASIPFWAQAAAAVLVLSAGAAIANLQVRYGADGLTIRTGWQQGAALPPGTAAAADRQAAAGAQPWQAALRDVEARLRTDLSREVHAQLAAAAVPVPAHSVAASQGVAASDVRALIADSERRQERQLALRLAQLAQDVDAQRQADLVRIEQNMGQLEGVTGAEAARQHELLNYLVRVSARQR